MDAIREEKTSIEATSEGKSEDEEGDDEGRGENTKRHDEAKVGKTGEKKDGRNKAVGASSGFKAPRVREGDEATRA